MYFFNFLDRNALANARLNNMHIDLKLKDGEFQTLLSILFVGYIAGQIPSNMVRFVARCNTRASPHRGTFVTDIFYDSTDLDQSSPLALHGWIHGHLGRVVSC